MSCPEERVVAFLAGDLSPDEAIEFDRHLLECETCWRATQADRVARLALERLREPAPPGLGERVAAAVSLAGSPSRVSGHARRSTSVPRRRPALVGALAAVLALGGLLGWWLSPRGEGDPPQLAAVIAMMPKASPLDASLRQGEQLMIDGQSLTVRSFDLSGTMAVVATSMRPFTMPPSSHLLTGSSPHAWMAMRGAMAVYGVNESPGTRSMFLVARVPMAELPLLAADLHLI